MLNFATLFNNFLRRLWRPVRLTLILMTFLYVWIGSSWNLVLEEQFAKFNILAKNALNKEELRYQNEEILFIDVSGIMTPIDRPEGKLLITDRNKLDTLYQLFHEYARLDAVIVCDLYFQYATPHDSSLQSAMSGFPNLLVLNNTNAEGNIIPNAFQAGTSGVSGYSQLEDSFLIFSNSLLKFKLINDAGHKSLPLLLFEKVNKVYTGHRSAVLEIGNEWYFNSVQIYDHLDPFYKEQVHPAQQLIQQLKLGRKSYVDELRQKKIILIGNFKDDSHKTLTGDLPGPVIILNVFHSLQQGNNAIKCRWVVLTFLFFVFLSDKVINKRKYFRKLGQKIDQLARYLGFKNKISFNWPILWIFMITMFLIWGIDLQIVAGVVILETLLFIGRIIPVIRRKAIKLLKR